MTNFTGFNGSILNQTYDLTRIFHEDAIEEPTRWLHTVNIELNSLIIIVFLAIFALVIFLTSRSLDNVSDSEAAVYAGLITSIISLLLFVVEVSGVTDAKLLSWPYVALFFVLTAIAILVNHWARRW